MRGKGDFSCRDVLGGSLQNCREGRLTRCGASCLRNLNKKIKIEFKVFSFLEVVHSELNSAKTRFWDDCP